MGAKIKKGAWVEIYRVVLEPNERAPQVPDDTKKVPLEMKVKGFLEKDAHIGDEVEIITQAGRRSKGKLVTLGPPYDHGFGNPVEELIGIGSEVRRLLRTNRTSGGR